MSIKTCVLVSGGGTNLQALIDAQARGDMPDVELSLVVSNVAGAYALERARRAGIEALTCTRSKDQSREAFEQQLCDLLGARGIEMIVLAGFMTILSAAFVARYPGRIINVHPALIPSFCGKGFYGLKVHEAALNYGVKLTGATVHLVNEVPDGGRILLQKAVDIHEDDTPETLQKRVMVEAEWVLLPQAAQMLARQLTKERET